MIPRDKAAQCHGCGATQGPGVRLMACSGCRVRLFCSRACQVDAWGAGHKSECKRLKKERKAEKRLRKAAAAKANLPLQAATDALNESLAADRIAAKEFMDRTDFDRVNERFKQVVPGRERHPNGRPVRGTDELAAEVACLPQPEFDLMLEVVFEKAREQFVSSRSREAVNSGGFHGSQAYADLVIDICRLEVAAHPNPKAGDVPVDSLGEIRAWQLRLPSSGQLYAELMFRDVQDGLASMEDILDRSTLKERLDSIRALTRGASSSKDKKPKAKKGGGKKKKRKGRRLVR